MIQTHIDIQKHDLGGGVPGEFDGIVAFEVFKKLGEGVGTMRPKQETILNEMQPEARLSKSGEKGILFKETHEQVGTGRGHSCAHGRSLDLEVMLESKEEFLWLRMNW
jgi:hypothetical protein